MSKGFEDNLCPCCEAKVLLGGGCVNPSCINYHWNNDRKISNIIIPMCGECNEEIRDLKLGCSNCGKIPG